MIPRKQFEEWLENPVTREVFKDIENIINEIKESVGNFDAFDADDPAVTQRNMNRAIGEIHGLGRILDITYEDTNESDTKPIGPTSTRS